MSLESLLARLESEAGIIREADQTAIRSAEVEGLVDAFETCAGHLELGGLPRAEAELEVAKITTAYARNRGYLWASLRAALAGYPELLAQVPDRPGPVDALPLGVPKLAVLKNQRVVRQGAFSGVPEVKA
jgi:hypothetical protein